MRPDNLTYMAYVEPEKPGTMGFELQRTLDDKTSRSKLERIVTKEYGYHQAKKALMTYDAIEYLKIWEKWLNKNGELDTFRNYLVRNEIDPIEPTAYSGCTGLHDKVRAYSTEALAKKNKKLEVIGLPADYKEKVLADEKSLGLEKSQIMYFYILHERTHIALQHTAGYNDNVDYEIKEGQVARVLFKYFKEQSENPKGSRSTEYYKPMMLMAATQLVDHSINAYKLTTNKGFVNSPDYLEARLELLKSTDPRLSRMISKPH